MMGSSDLVASVQVVRDVRAEGVAALGERDDGQLNKLSRFQNILGTNEESRELKQRHVQQRVVVSRGWEKNKL